jgi:hypothetical protein
MSPTGKRQRQGVPSIRDTVSVVSMLIQCNSEDDNNSNSVPDPLQGYGKSGSLVTKATINVFTTTATFAMMGGDSLTAT